MAEEPRTAAEVTRILPWREARRAVFATMVLAAVAGLRAAEQPIVREFPSGKTPAATSFPVAEGNYRVRVHLGGAGASETTVKAEARRLMLEKISVAAGESLLAEFVVNVRTPTLPPRERNAPGGDAVTLNEREKGSPNWNSSLDLEFLGGAPAVREITIERVTVPTLYLVGDSTVTDQSTGDGASWGRMLPRFFNGGIAIANHAESGETLKSFMTSLRLAKVLSTLQAGDWLFIQFGHNDQKKNWPQTYADADTTYKAYLRAYVAEARLRGAFPVLITSPERRNFAPDGKIRSSHGRYPQAVREVARELDVPLIDLEPASRALYERLGPGRAPSAFADGGRDATHHNEFGADELAKCVVEGIRANNLPVARFLR